LVVVGEQWRNGGMGVMGGYGEFFLFDREVGEGVLRGFG
jgi:hypothetical protein